MGYTFPQEKEIAKLEEGIKNVKEGNLAEENETLDKLLGENSKLKFRLDILNRVSHHLWLFSLQTVNSMMKYF